jgi:hypothetical protein
MTDDRDHFGDKTADNSAHKAYHRLHETTTWSIFPYFGGEVSVAWHRPSHYLPSYSPILLD